MKEYGRLDIVVNNSGVYAFGALEEITEESFHHMFNINVLGLLLVTKAASKHLGEGASIINIGSAVTELFPPASAVYTAAHQTADWGALLGPGGTLNVRIFQLSALVGRGAPKIVTLTF